jgi:hypothetical protein
MSRLIIKTILIEVTKMPKITVSDTLRGDMPNDALPVSQVATSLGVSEPFLTKLIKNGVVTGWLYMGRFYYCRERDVRELLQARPVGPLNRNM